MHKLIVTYAKPANPDAFLKHYRDVHVPLMQRIPGLHNLEVNRITGAPLGGEPALFLITELSFADAATFQAAMESAENQACGEDAMAFAEGLFSVMTATAD